MRKKKKWKLGNTYLLGITGTVAAGKSTAAEGFRRLGVPVFDADLAGHDVLDTLSAKRALWNAFGPLVFTAESFFPGKTSKLKLEMLRMPVFKLSKAQISRKQLAKLAFAARGKDNSIRELLEGITHPAIEVLFNQFYRQQEEAKVPLVILDAPLLFETEWNEWCDGVACVDADIEIRRQRGLERGWTNRDLDRREKNQWKPEQKRKKADFILDGNGTPDDLFTQTASLLEQIKSI